MLITNGFRVFADNFYDTRKIEDGGKDRNLLHTFSGLLVIKAIIIAFTLLSPARIDISHAVNNVKWGEQFVFGKYLLLVYDA